MEQRVECPLLRAETECPLRTTTPSCKTPQYPNSGEISHLPAVCLLHIRLSQIARGLCTIVFFTCQFNTNAVASVCAFPWSGDSSGRLQERYDHSVRSYFGRIPAPGPVWVGFFPSGRYRKKVGS